MDKFKGGHQSCEINIDGRIYVIDFSQSSQTNQCTRKERKIRCFFSLPLHWQMTDEDALAALKDASLESMQRVTDRDKVSKLQRVLNQSLKRADGARCQCLHGKSKYVVKEAYQIRNLLLWRRYQRFVRSIHGKHKHHGISLETCPPVGQALTEFAEGIGVDQAGNERILLHGTRDFEVAKIIAAEGFDNRTANEGLYGKGTYFAAQTCKSAQYAILNGFSEKASQQMLGTMLLARVAIGDPFYTPGPCSDTRPPEKNGVRADSIIANVGITNGVSTGGQAHLEVVTFDPAQAYPEFILRYTEE
eukprot:Skav233202  [mRNA]  locus=scaffold24:459618:460813:- [translate_table: standard]